LVLATDLEQVEEVSTAGVDLDQVLVRVGRERRQGDCAKVEGSGNIRGNLYGSHDCKVVTLQKTVLICSSIVVVGWNRTRHHRS
jgi:hypothetical protein